MNKFTNDITVFDIDTSIMGNRINNLGFIKKLILLGITLFAIFYLTSEK